GLEGGDLWGGCRRLGQGKRSGGFGLVRPGLPVPVAGPRPLSGDYKGHQQIGAFFQRTMELSGGTFGIDVHNVLADGEVVVALTTVRAERNGRAASFPEVHVWRLKNGKVIDFRAYQRDQHREDRF